jgi:archaellum component FlaC
MSIGELPFDIEEIFDRLKQLNDLFTYVQNRLDTLAAELVNLIARFNNVEYRLDAIDNSIVTLQNRDDDLQNQINGITAFIGLIQSKLNLLETSVNDLESRVTDIEDQLPSMLKKASPINGYNPYYLNGTVTAKVWMFEITPINDNSIKFYYVQFNEINGPSGGISDWVPLPGGVHANYIYTYHPEYHLGGLLTGAPTIPAAYSAKGISYRLIISNTEDYFRLVINAGTPGGDDYIGFLIIGNKG